MVILSVLVFFLTSCSSSGFKTYQDALRKTEDIKKGSEHVDVEINMTFNTEGLDTEQKTQLNYLNKILLEIRSQYDLEQNQMLTDVYYYYGGLGYDALFIMNDSKSYLRIPILEKYLDISNLQDNNVWGDTFKPVSDKWLSILNEKDVVTGKNTILNTEDGDVKASIITVKVDNEQSKEVVMEAINTTFNENVMDYFYEGTVEEKNALQEKIKNLMENADFENFEEKTYIDFDGYIIKQTMTMDINFNNTLPGDTESMTICITSRNWDIGKQQTIEFPDIRNEDILDVDTLNDANADIPNINASFLNSMKSLLQQ